jgi:hypothetical protein
MPTDDIARHEWQGFLDMFSRQHEGWRATVVILGGDGGVSLEAREMPLVGVTLDVINGNRVIAIILRDEGSGHLTHIVSKPKYVRLKQTEEGAHEALVIEAENGVKTLLRFRSTMRTEMLDGVLPDRPMGRVEARRKSA